MFFPVRVLPILKKNNASIPAVRHGLNYPFLQNRHFMPVWVCFCISLTGVNIALESAALTDIQSHWAQQDIQHLVENQVLGGYPDGSFRPNAPMTRAEFSAVLAKLLNLQPAKNTPPGKVSFKDLPRNNWAFPVVELVKSQRLMTGYPQGKFYPNSTMTRAEVVKVAVTASGATMVNDKLTDGLLSGYADADQVPSWARQAVATSLQLGLLQTPPNTKKLLNMNRPATRGDVAALLTHLETFLHAGVDKMPIAEKPLEPLTEILMEDASKSTPPLKPVVQKHVSMAQAAFTSQKTSKVPALLQPEKEFPADASLKTELPSSRKISNSVASLPEMPRKSAVKNMASRNLKASSSTFEFIATVSTPINSQLNKVGDMIVLLVEQPVTAANGQLVIPSSSQVFGIVSQVSGVSDTQQEAQLGITLHELVLPSGRHVPLSGSLATEDGLLRGGTTKGRIFRVKQAEALSRSLAIPTEASFSSVSSLPTRGRDVILAPGEQLQIRLLQPPSLETQALSVK